MGKKLVLGTAQFGMNYGINNTRGKIPRNEVYEILDESLNSGVDVLDTAHSYGESETVIGDFIKYSKRKFKIISKLPKCFPKEIESIFNSSLRKLNIEQLYGYEIHDFQNYIENPNIWHVLEKLKAQGKIKKIGFSLYFHQEIEHLLERRIGIDIVQVPYNIFDQRFERYFPELKKHNIEIHVRSVFLQGLVFKNPDSLAKHFVKVKRKISDLHLLSIETNIPVAALCLNFVINNKFVDKVVVGIDNNKNLKEILHSEKYIQDVEKVLSRLYSLKEDDLNIIIPSNWKLN